MMRHNEERARFFVEQTHAVVEQYKQILGERDARLALLEEKYGQVLDLKGRLASMRDGGHLDGRATNRLRTLAIACVCAVTIALAALLRSLAR